MYKNTGSHAFELRLEIQTNGGKRHGKFRKPAQKRYYPLRDAENPYKVSLVEITEAQYRALYPEIWATQKREQYHHRCICTKKYL